MPKEKNPTEKFTTTIPVSGIPIHMKEQIDSKTDRLGITNAAYIKNLINADLKADKMENFNKAG